MVATHTTPPDYRSSTSAFSGHAAESRWLRETPEGRAEAARRAGGAALIHCQACCGRYAPEEVVDGECPYCPEIARQRGEEEPDCPLAHDSDARAESLEGYLSDADCRGES